MDEIFAKAIADIEVMLRKGLKPEEVANYGDYPLALVKEVENNMLSLA